MKRKKIAAAATAIAACIAFGIVLVTVILPRHKAAEQNVSVGDTVTLGRYEQDNNDANGKEEIEWIVLAEQEDSILLVSKYALDCRPYHTAYAGVTWERCSLRQWLNGTFLNAAFSAEEQNRIVRSAAAADENPSYGMPPGNPTADRVFLLSIAEANRYFRSDDARKCEPTAYSAAHEAHVKSGVCWWWLRSPGNDPHTAAGVGYGGAVSSAGSNVTNDVCAVRPALWITA